jgi:hypothetical protein
MTDSRTPLLVLLLFVFSWLTSAYGQLTPSGDAYTNTSSSGTNYGASALLDV